MGAPSGSVPPPHLLGTPPPPQIAGAVQPPQLSTPPQPSPIGPQSPGAHEAFVGVHTGPPSPEFPPQRLGTPPPPQLCPPVHVPHNAVRLPHPSATTPQLALTSAHVSGVHVPPPSLPTLPVPHLFRPPPPQMASPVHVPQDAIRPPHPSPCAPHSAPSCAHVRGTQEPGPVSPLSSPPPPTITCELSFVEPSRSPVGSKTFGPFSDPQAARIPEPESAHVRLVTSHERPRKEFARRIPGMLPRVEG